MEENKNLLVPEALVRALVGYLATKPYMEVAQLLGELGGCVSAKESLERETVPGAKEAA